MTGETAPRREVPGPQADGQEASQSGRSLVDRVLRVFADHGPLARTLERFEPRLGQRAMAAAVAQVFASGGTLLVEAGTGTGKTLAYLVPAILSGHRVLVSTGTKNLQEQIFFKDLPMLQAALGRPFTATYMKGRGNYLCLHRFEALRAAEGFRRGEDAAYLPLVAEWAARTETGDRAELDELPEEVAFWSDIAATSEHCLGTSCPRYDDCFVTRMRRQAAEADLVIVNHHLLCADAAVRQSAYGEVIPSCRYLIIDEAHLLEDVATQYFGCSVSTHRIAALVRDGERLVGARLFAGGQGADDVAALLAQIDEKGRRLFGALEQLGAPEERVRVTPETLAPVGDLGLGLVGLLEGLGAVVQLAGDASEEVRALGRRAGALGAELAFLLKASDPDYVFYVEVGRRGAFLRAAPIDVSAIVREALLARATATVLTSATLAVDGSFEFVKTRLGLEGAHAVRLPSEFDYSRQAILYLPRGMPDPRSPAFGPAAAREIAEILGRTRGRAFVLFTSYARLREVEQRLAGTLPYPLLVQGTAPRTSLLGAFRATPHAVLLATTSFWQGVDVVGEALSCVIIDKLPFAVPDDPITAARIEALAARGGEPFHEYQVPLAVLMLLQGLGRLIRHRQDRGVLAILDPRLRTRGYGRRFLASLPPAPITDRLEDIERFFSSEVN